MKTSLALAAAGVALVALATPASAASFDCAKAQSDVEKLICADPALSRLDERIARRYQELLAGMDKATLRALRQDQQWFLSARDEAVRQAEGPERKRTLSNRLADRAAMLESIALGMERFWPEGVWHNAAGGMLVLMNPDGRYSVEINTAEPSSGRWVCNVEGVGTERGDEVHVVDATIAGWSIVLRREGQALVAEERRGNGTTGGSPYCGVQGSVAGSYFLRLPTIALNTPAPPVANPVMPEPPFLIEKGMAYVKARQKLFATGWRPLEDLTCYDNVYGASGAPAGENICETMPELSATSGDGHLVMHMMAPSGLTLRIDAHGDTLKWNVPGEEEALVVTGWEIY